MKTEAVANQKGGVGKSMISCHRCFDLMDQQKTTLFVDNDPQGNSGRCILKNPLASEAPFTTLDLYSEMNFDDFKPESLVTVVTADRKLSAVARYETDAPFIFKEN